MPELISKTLSVCRTGPVVTVAFPSFEQTHLVRHLFTTRCGGVSQGPFASMNLAFSEGENQESVYENFRRICYVSGIYPGDMVFSAQVHGTNVLEVGKMDRGRGFMKPSAFEAVDGLITNQRQVCLVTFHADCCPVFLLDPVRRAIGLCHAGWRGTVRKIAKITVEKMHKAYGCDPADILAGIGPSIGPTSFEIRQDVESFFEEAFPDSVSRLVICSGTGTFYADLWQANRQVLLEAGVKSEHITVTDLDTFREEEYFYSHRRTGKPRGCMAAFLELL